MKFFLLIMSLSLLTGCETLTTPKILNSLQSKSCIKGDCKNGYGTFVLKNQTYTGYFTNNKANGLGTLDYKDGSKYTGEFIKGKFYGHGTLVLPNEEKYEGQFVNGLYSGQGIYTFIDGRQNHGGWLKGKLNGKVKISLKDGSKYIGL